MKKDKVTVKQIAALAGVSAATVSRTVNHPELVKGDTVRRVERAMSELGISFPASLDTISQEQPIIVMNIPSISNSFYQEIIKGAKVAAKAHGCHLLIHESPLDQGSIRDFCHLLHMVHAAGVILLNLLPQNYLQQLNAIAPVIQCCEYSEHSDLPYVSIDDVAAAEEATQYLFSCGRNKIAMLNGPASFKYAAKRQEGFLNAVKKAEVTIPRNWLVQLPEIDYELAYSAACRLLNSEIRPNAFFAVSDTLAAAVLRAARRYALNVPKDIMVVGFDNNNLSMMTDPSITTVDQSAFRQGHTACELLLEMTQGIMPKSILLETKLIIRESTLVL